MQVELQAFCSHNSLKKKSSLSKNFVGEMCEFCARRTTGTQSFPSMGAAFLCFRYMLWG